MTYFWTDTRLMVAKCFCQTAYFVSPTGEIEVISLSPLRHSGCRSRHHTYKDSHLIATDLQG